MAVSPVMPVIENWTARSGFRTTVPSMARPVSVGIPATPVSPERERGRRWGGGWGGGWVGGPRVRRRGRRGRARARGRERPWDARRWRGGESFRILVGGGSGAVVDALITADRGQDSSAMGRSADLALRWQARPDHGGSLVSSRAPNPSRRARREAERRGGKSAALPSRRGLPPPPRL